MKKKKYTYLRCGVVLSKLRDMKHIHTYIHTHHHDRLSAALGAKTQDITSMAHIHVNLKT